MKIAAVADTHAVLWYLYGDARLSTNARGFINQITADGDEIAVSSISLVEVVFLIDKGRISASVYGDLRAVLADPERVFVETPVTASLVDSLHRVSRTDIPDMPDRIVAATALYLGVPIISRDGRIRSSTLETIW